jgi:hypothetical protein
MIRQGCQCTYCQLLAYGWKEQDLKGHAKDCPIFDPKQDNHSLDEEVTFHGPVFENSGLVERGSGQVRVEEKKRSEYEESIYQLGYGQGYIQGLKHSSSK